MVRSAPLRMASIMRASSATFLIQAPSFLVFIPNLAVPISAVASEVDLNGYPMITDSSFSSGLPERLARISRERA